MVMHMVAATKVMSSCNGRAAILIPPDIPDIGMLLWKHCGGINFTTAPDGRGKGTFKNGLPSSGAQL